VEDKCKQHGHWNSQQVERAEVHNRADRLLAAASEHTFKVQASNVIIEVLSQLL
jgi:hypothetical protein